MLDRAALPAGVMQASAEKPSGKQRKCIAVSKSNQRILVVDDNSINREVALAQLRVLGYEADAANNGAEAVRAVQQKNYDLVFMDCEMPVMDGYEATRRIRKSRRADVPVIALTAGALLSDQERCLKVGMNDYLAKPMNLEDLRRALAKWLPAAKPGISGKNNEPTLDTVAELPPQALSEALPSSQIIDTNKLLANVNRDTGLLRRLVSIFNAQIPKRMEAIRHAIATGNAAVLAQEAHAVKAAIRNLCCENATDMAAQLEMLGRTGDVSQASGILASLDCAIAELTPELARLVEPQNRDQIQAKTRP